MLTNTTPTLRVDAEHTMLEEVASWSAFSHEDFKVSKCSQPGIYSYRFATALGGQRIIVELTTDEAAIFERHLSFPASRADLEDLPQRVRVSKLLALIS